jgi:hypothetical protein
MLRIKVWAAVGLSAAVLGVSVAPALGAANPTSNGCTGNIIATFNHESGISRASDNPHSSAGPGFFIAGEYPGSVADAVHGVQSAFCSGP